MRSIILTILMGSFFTCTLQAQLGWQEANSLLEYWKSNKQFSVYSDAVQRKVVYDPANATILRNCIESARYCNKMMRLQTQAMYSFGSLYKDIPAVMGKEYQQKLMPDFDEKAYQEYQEDVGGIGVEYGPLMQTLKGDAHTALLAKYAAKRKQKLSNDDAFASLAKEDPTGVSKLRYNMGELYNSKGKPLTNKDPMMEKLVSGWLEMQYWTKISDEVQKKINKDMEQAEERMKPCNLTAANLLEKNKNVKTEWNGTFDNTKTEELIVINGNSATWEYEILSTPIGSGKFYFDEFNDDRAYGKYNFEINDAKLGLIYRSGSFAARLDGDVLTINYTEESPKKGSKMKTEYTRKRLIGN